MLGLRYVACDDCDTVWAVPAADPAVSGPCPDCGGGSVTEVTDRLGDASYFLAERE
ncbi:hypothetical protein [Halosegnis marinus]|uniref:Zinc ribbon domain-containing protein n=1 Tax=Halosegnis marinus TaxID=3034023 RepID=A0ABD5ZMV5_9EURY|nr:hypothetical protein [Halosegnis sp. DT85]